MTEACLPPVSFVRERWPPGAARSGSVVTNVAPVSSFIEGSRSKAAS